MKKTRRIFRLTGLFLLLVTTGLVACGKPHHEESAYSPPAVTARLTQAELSELPQEVELQGTVEARQNAALSARVMAMVTAVHVNAGDHVSRGQLLIEIDPQASEGKLAQAQGALSQARAALVLAERNYQRFTALADTQAASELEVDMARMQFEQAAGAVGQAEGAVAAASSVASDARVVSPFNGRVAHKMVEVGDLAAPGRPLMRIESVAGRRLTVAVPESLMHQAKLQPGDRLRVQIDSRPDLGLVDGTVAEMTPGADPASHSFQVKLDLPSVDLTTGSAGRAWIPTQTRSTVLVPREAILRQGGLTLVVIRNAEGLASSRVVTVGRQLPDEKIEVLSGLTGGETVLLGLTTTPPAGAKVEAA